MPTREELLAQAKKPAPEALRLHPFYQGKVQLMPKCPIRNAGDFAILVVPADRGGPAIDRTAHAARHYSTGPEPRTDQGLTAFRQGMCRIGAISLGGHGVCSGEQIEQMNCTNEKHRTGSEVESDSLYRRNSHGTPASNSH